MLLIATSPLPIDQCVENEMKSASDRATTMSPGIEPNRSGNGGCIPFRVCVQCHNQIVRKAPFLPGNRAQAEA